MTEGPVDPVTGSGGGSSGDHERVERAVRDLQAGRDVERSFDFLFHRFSPALTRKLMRWGAPPEEARDLNQEVFQRIYRDVGRFRGGDPFFASWVAWVWQLARTTWLRHLRARQAQKRPADPRPLDSVVEERDLRIARPPGQLDRVLGRELEDEVRRAVEELPAQELRCVILHYYQDLSIREISVVLKIAQGTVKAHLHHARAKLMTRLGDRMAFDDDPVPARGTTARRGGARA